MKNSRSIKNIVMVFLILVASLAVYFTMTNIKADDNSNNMMNNKQMRGTPPDMQNGLNNRGPGMGTPPDRRDSSNENDDNSTSENDTNNNDSENNYQNDNNNENNMGTPPDMNDSDNNFQNDNNSNTHRGQFMNKNSSIKTIYYVLFAIESLVIASLVIYLLISNFNKKNFKETLKSSDKLMIYILLVIIATSALTVIESSVSKKYFLEDKINTKMNNNIENTNSVEASGAKEIDSVESLSNETYTSKKSDENAILVKSGGDATLNDVTIEKEGDSSNTEQSDFSGVNAAILTQSKGKTTIKNANITTNGKGANAVFSTGEDSKVYISDSTIETKGEGSSRGLDATYGGYIEADKVKITTKGQSSATLATDRGEGTVKVTDSTLETNGAGSPVIYSTGEITLTNSKGTANSSQMVVIEGKNTATVTNSKLTASAKGNRNDVDNAGIMIYQSMSGDAGEGTGTFNSKNSTLTIDENSDYYKTAPMFFVTNTKAVINLEDTKISYGSNILLSVKGTSEWGNSGSNGGDVTINAETQTLKGNIELDKLSTLELNLTSSSYEGTINSENTAKEITLKLDKSSKIKLTGDSYISSLENDDSSNSNIDFNGYKLYVNGKAIN